jgi:hypothetical protein
LSVVAHSTPLRYDCSQKTGNTEDNDNFSSKGKQLHPGDRIRFDIDMDVGVVSIFVNDDKLPVQFTHDLKGKTVFPAVNVLGNYSQKVELVEIAFEGKLVVDGILAKFSTNVFSQLCDLHHNHLPHELNASLIKVCELCPFSDSVFIVLWHNAGNARVRFGGAVA